MYYQDKEVNKMSKDYINGYNEGMNDCKTIGLYEAKGVLTLVEFTESFSYSDGYEKALNDFESSLMSL